MYCTQCGVELEDRDAYCSQCGVVTGRGVRAGVKPRLLRSRYHNKIAGVCAGMATYLDTDATLMRVIWLVLLFLFFPAAILGYIAAWIVIPKEPVVTVQPAPAAAPAYPQP